MTKYLRISYNIIKPLFTYDFATTPIWISLNMRGIFFSFLSVYFLVNYLIFWLFQWLFTRCVRAPIFRTPLSLIGNRNWNPSAQPGSQQRPQPRHNISGSTVRHQHQQRLQSDNSNIDRRRHRTTQHPSIRHLSRRLRHRHRRHRPHIARRHMRIVRFRKRKPMPISRRWIWKVIPASTGFSFRNIR